MKTLVVCLSLALTCPLATSAGTRTLPAPQQTQQKPKPETKAAGAPAPTSDAEMNEMMARAKRFTQPGAHHKTLERFVGKWSTETQFFMGGQARPATDKGTAEFAWLMPGRWMKMESSGTFIGRPSRSFILLGYDNFRQSFVSTQISTMDTAMTHAEGDMDPGDKALILYGTLDEYLTGEVAKMVKYVWRFVSPNQIVLEVHDLPIGESNTKVVQITFNRQS